MSDPSTPPAPIQVSADPKEAQIAAGIRQIGAALAIIVAAFGFTGYAAKIGIVVSLAPQIAVVLFVVGGGVWTAVTWIGQQATRKHAKQAITMASVAPDDVAQVVTK